MRKIIDLETYPRRSHFEYFGRMAFPYVGLTANVDVTNLIRFAKEQGFRVSDLELIQTNSVNDTGVGALCTLRLPKKTPHAEILQMLSGIERVRYVEEL